MAFLSTNPLHSLKISYSTDEENLFDDQGLLKLVIISFILISHILMKVKTDGKHYVCYLLENIKLIL